MSETVGSTILDKDGKVVNASAATTAAYSSMVDKMKGHTEQQQEALKNIIAHNMICLLLKKIIKQLIKLEPQ